MERLADLAFITRAEASYELIRRFRLSRGLSLSLELESVRAMFVHFPEACKVFVVKDQEKIIAATIAIVVNDQILYNFYPAHDAAYQTFSPVVMLTDGLYRFCQQQGFALLDLGQRLLIFWIIDPKATSRHPIQFRSLGRSIRLLYC